MENAGYCDIRPTCDVGRRVNLHPRASSTWSITSAESGTGEGAESRLPTEMELAGLEPATSWVRLRARIQKPKSGAFRS